METEFLCCSRASRQPAACWDELLYVGWSWASKDLAGQQDTSEKEEQPKEALLDLLWPHPAEEL